MKELIKRILEKWACKHTWELYMRLNNFGKRKDMPYQTRDTLTCKNCGKIKKITL